MTPRKEVREGRSFSPDEFAIALEQVVAGTAPKDYSDPKEFLARTVFTSALREHLGMVLRRLDGKTENTAPVMALVTQFGGGKTHALTAMFHLVRKPELASRDERIKALLKEAGVKDVPRAKVAVFVGNAWDPQPGRETPWIDLANQLAGERGITLLGPAAKTTPPGTEALGRLFEAAGGTVLVLMDEVLNFLNRHRPMAESFYAFLDNLVRAMTGTTRSVAVISLPRSQVEMTDYDLEWQEKFTKAVRRVARELIVNEEGEIAEVVRRRLFEDLGPDKACAAVAKAFADWCFERRNQLPPEWTAVDVAATDAKAKEHLKKRFEACYPFHPATLSVFQRKWQTLPQYQQTRGTLAMLAQWVSWAYREGFQYARKEPLLTLGSAPLAVSKFRDTILGQLGEPRLIHAVETDLAGERSHARALDAGTGGPLEDIHYRVGTAILFESSGGMVDKVAHLPELRFALGEPGLDTASVDNAAVALERKGFYLRRIGKDGYRFGFQPTLKKVVGDRRASLDEGEVKRELRKFVREEWERRTISTPIWFPEESTALPDAPRLTFVVLGPEKPLDDGLRTTLVEWTARRGESARLYPAALVWCAVRPGRELSEKVELYLAWKRVADEINSGLLGEFEPLERQEAKRELTNAEEDAREEVWASYQYVLLHDRSERDGLRLIPLGAGHASAGDSLTSRVLAAMKAEGLLNESVGGSYLQRNWPEALKASGAWPLSGVRQSFLDGSLIRLLDPERTLTEQIIRFVEQGGFGFAVGSKPSGAYDRVWYKEALRPEDIAFDAQTFLLSSQKAQALTTPAVSEPQVEVRLSEAMPVVTQGPAAVASRSVSLRASGSVPPELWNKLGTRLIPKLRMGKVVELQVQATVEVSASERENLRKEIRRILDELGLDSNWLVVDREDSP